MHCLAVAGGPNEMQVALWADLVMLPDFDATHNHNHTDKKITEQESTESDDESTNIDEQPVANSSKDDYDHADSEGTNDEAYRSEGMESSDEERAKSDDDQEGLTENGQFPQTLDLDKVPYNLSHRTGITSL